MPRVEVHCPNCFRWVGWDWPDTYWEQGYFEPGWDGVDQFRDELWRVYCSQKCLNEKGEEDNG